MIPLAQEFTFDQNLFRQVARTGRVILLERRRTEHSKPSFEVVIVQRHPARTIQGREYPARESMPPSTSWGVSGWSPIDADAAKQKFREIVAKRRA